jgi:MFS family permease
MATTNFFRALGGAVGAASLGAVFASQGGVVDGVRLVFGIAAPLALLALALIWRMREEELDADEPAPAGAPDHAAPRLERRPASPSERTPVGAA